VCAGSSSRLSWGWRRNDGVSAHKWGEENFTGGVGFSAQQEAELLFFFVASYRADIAADDRGLGNGTGWARWGRRRFGR